MQDGKFGIVQECQKMDKSSEIVQWMIPLKEAASSLWKFLPRSFVTLTLLSPNQLGKSDDISGFQIRNQRLTTTVHHAFDIRN